MTDKDTMIYLRNAALALRRLAQERGIRISLSASEGYANARAGAYEYVNCSKERYEYCPIDQDHSAWREVTPDQIRFGKEPEDHD